MDTNYRFSMVPDTMKLRFRVNACAGGALQHDKILTSSGALLENQWNHVMATFNGEKLRIYINGAEDASLAWGSSMIACPNGSAVWIGDAFSGNLDEITVHNGALKAALGLHGKPTMEADLDPIPDTVYFLTDGSPTRGEITTADELLSWFENLNRFAKVELHVIAMGNLGVDIQFLQRLAKVGGGEFIHVREE